MNEHEEKMISAFILKEKQDRYRFLLNNPKKRREGLDRLNHCNDFNPKYATWLPSNADVVSLLQKEGSPKEVYVISDTQAIDGELMPLDDAITEAAKGGWGTIVSCIPGQLAYYYDEAGETQALLKRKPGR